MKSLTKSARVNAALQVIQHINTGMTVADACRAVGMPRSSYYYLVNKNPEALSEFQTIIDTNNREQLGLILLSKTEMLQKLIEDGLSDATKPKDRLAIYLKLNEFADTLTDTLHIDSQLSKDAHEFLKRGPHLIHATSKLTAIERTLTIETDS